MYRLCPSDTCDSPNIASTPFRDSWICFGPSGALLTAEISGARSNGDLGGVHLCLMDMTAFGASHGPVLEAGAGRRNALDRRATLASRAAG